MSIGRWAYGCGKGNRLTGRNNLYKVIGNDPSERQRASREYVCSNRDKEEQEVREKMGRRVIVAGKIERVKRQSNQVKNKNLISSPSIVFIMPGKQ